MNLLLASVLWLLASESVTAGPSVLQRYESAVESDSSALTLYVDNTFKYESRGSSCWLWHDTAGTWSKQGALLTLTYLVTVDDSRDGVRVESGFKDANRILVVVTDPDGAPLPGILVTFNGHGYESATGPDGRAFVDYEDIPEFSGSGWCRSRRLEHLIVRVGSSTTTYPLDNPLANYFEVIVEPKPQSHEETHSVRFRIKGRTLALIRAAGEATEEGGSDIWVSSLKEAVAERP